MSSVIDRQLAALNQSATEATSSMPGADAATSDVEELITMSLALYDGIRASVRRWQESVRDWDSNAWLPQARQFEARYRKLHEIVRRVAPLLDATESRGIRLDNGDAFRAAKLDLDLLCELSVDRMLRADEGFRQKRGRLMAEVRDELRGRLGA